MGELWLAYFRLELVGLHKVHARREQLGLGGLLGEKEAAEEEEEEEEEDDDDEDAAAE